MTKKDQKMNDKLEVIKHFEYKLRKVGLKFSLVGYRELTDFKVLLQKGIEDIDKILKDEYTKIPYDTDKKEE